MWRNGKRASILGLWCFVSCVAKLHKCQKINLQWIYLWLFTCNSDNDSSQFIVVLFYHFPPCPLHKWDLNHIVRWNFIFHSIQRRVYFSNQPPWHNCFTASCKCLAAKISLHCSQEMIIRRLPHTVTISIGLVPLVSKFYIM